MTKQPGGAGESRGTAYFPRYAGEALATNLGLVDRVRALADGKGCTPGQLALAWVLAQGDDIAPIPGTRRVTHLEENVGATAVTLTSDDLAALVKAIPRDAVVGARYGDMSSVNR
jgi:aryl-alcohol dehydrogenase-like predicted oxidoreductase